MDIDGSAGWSRTSSSDRRQHGLNRRMLDGELSVGGGSGVQEDEIRAWLANGVFTITSQFLTAPDPWHSFNLPSTGIEM